MYPVDLIFFLCIPSIWWQTCKVHWRASFHFHVIEFRMNFFILGLLHNVEVPREVDVQKGEVFFFCFSSVYCANTGTLTSFKYCNIDTLKQTGIDSIQTIDSWLQSATLTLTSCKQMNKQMREMKIDLLDALWSIIYIFSTLNFFSFCKKKDFPLQWSQSIWFIISSYANCENYIIKGFSI